MALPTTNISLGAIQNEFLGDDPISLSEYYRGGAYVGLGITSAYGTIPTSGQINMGVFRGTSAFVPGSTTFTASGTFTVPSGYTTLTIEVWGAGGCGGGTEVVAAPTGGASSVSGTGLTTMTANGGVGGNPTSADVPSAGGAGGTASGGTTTNTSGNSGTTGNADGDSGLGGNGGNGISGSISGGIGGTGGQGSEGSGIVSGGNGTAPGAGGGGGGLILLLMGFPSERGGGGGGSGGYSKTITSSVAAGTVLTVTVGTSGTPQTGGGSAGAGRVIFTYT